MTGLARPGPLRPGHWRSRSCEGPLQQLVRALFLGSCTQDDDTTYYTNDNVFFSVILLRMSVV